MAADRLTPPASALTRAAEQCARRVLPVPLLDYSYRTYVFGRALGELEDIDVDTELLFAGALLHDSGLVNPTGDADFTLTSSRLTRVVAEEVGLSTVAADTLLTAITDATPPGRRWPATRCSARLAEQMVHRAGGDAARRRRSSTARRPGSRTICPSSS